MPRNSSVPGEGNTVFQPMCGSTRAAMRLTDPGHTPTPGVLPEISRDGSSPSLKNICIGMQIFFSEGLEPSREHAGSTSGVGVWSGSVSRIEARVLPHIGWNTVLPPSGSELFRGIESESFYFVHSYAAKESIGKFPSWSEYGERFLSALEDGVFSATQFHPEKSGKAGLALINNWTRTL